jgi:RHS repeat-associated protein
MTTSSATSSPRQFRLRFGCPPASAHGGGATGATGTVREYIYLPEAEIAPTAGSRTTVDRPIAVVEAVNTASPVTWFVHVDHLNRPIKMTNAAKAAVWDAAWLPWGGVHSITGSATLDARFPGQWFQLETGLHYNWHRSYDPSIGRYTQPDPLGFVDGPSVYGYALGAPQSSVDRDGQNVVSEALKLARDCYKNPEKCRRDLMCPMLEQGKRLSCNINGCASPSMQPHFAHFRMRAAEACLATRDAINAFCPLNATIKHQTPWPIERKAYENKANKCEEVCGNMRIYR